MEARTQPDSHRRVPARGGMHPLSVGGMARAMVAPTFGIAVCARWRRGWTPRPDRFETAATCGARVAQRHASSSCKGCRQGIARECGFWKPHGRAGSLRCPSSSRPDTHVPRRIRTNRHSCSACRASDVAWRPATPPAFAIGMRTQTRRGSVPRTRAPRSPSTGCAATMAVPPSR